MRPAARARLRIVLAGAVAAGAWLLAEQSGAAARESEALRLEQAVLEEKSSVVSAAERRRASLEKETAALEEEIGRLSGSVPRALDPSAEKAELEALGARKGVEVLVSQSRRRDADEFEACEHLVFILGREKEADGVVRGIASQKRLMSWKELGRSATARRGVVTTFALGEPKVSAQPRVAVVPEETWLWPFSGEPGERRRFIQELRSGLASKAEVLAAVERFETLQTRLTALAELIEETRDGDGDEQADVP